MKTLKTAAQMVKAEEARRAKEAAEIVKRDGIFVQRKLLPHSAKLWHAWGTKHVIPNLVPEADLHVTIVHSTVDVKMPLIQTAMNIETASEHAYHSGVFALFGEAENVLVFAMQCWELHDRHWAFCSNGAICTWSSYRPHLTLSTETPDGWELSDEALADVPRWIVLGPEQAEAPKLNVSTVAMSDSFLEVSPELRAAAAEMAKSEDAALSAIDAYDLADIGHGRLSAAVAKRLGALTWAPAELKDAVEAKTEEVKKRVQKEVSISVHSLPEEIQKSLQGASIAKANDEEQIVMGVASVSTMKGELVEDSHGDFITTRALVEFNRSLMSGSRAGKFMHEGEACTEVVAGLVLTSEWQKALGIELDYEPYLVEIHVPDPVDWAEVKKGDWMLSVAGLMWYYEDQANAEV